MFGTSGIRGPVGETVTAELALSVGRAVATAGATVVVIGRDVRESGGMLVDAVSAGIRECGSDAIEIGVATTPTIARSVQWQDADVGISITASHNPPADNGIKLWSAEGQAFSREALDEITRVIDTASFSPVSWDGIGQKRRWGGAVKRHREALVAAISPLDGVSVVVDVGNGTGSLTADALVDLGCKVETLNSTPDGRFPSRPSEPTPETCATLCSVVRSTDADLGIAHDGDADRMCAVDEGGRFVGGDELLSLFGCDAIDRADGSTIAAPINTSLAVEDALGEFGGSLSRTRVGDGFVAERTADPDVVFGGEPSGAWIWPEQSRCPDGPLAACKLVELVAENGSLADQLGAFPRYPIHRESIHTHEKKAVMERVEDVVEDRGYSYSTLDGLRVDLEDGWFLIRASGTEPIVRITAEARENDRSTEILDRAREIVSDVTG